MARAWLEQAFAAEQVERHGGVVRRQISSVVREASKEEFIEVAKSRGAFLIFETPSQLVAVFRPDTLILHEFKQPA